MIACMEGTGAASWAALTASLGEKGLGEASGGKSAGIGGWEKQGRSPRRMWTYLVKRPPNGLWAWRSRIG